MNGRWGVLIAGFALAGCSVTADLYGVVGNGTEIFKGTATGYSNGTGTMEMQSDAGTKCIGDFVANSSHRGGAGILSCNDGRQAQIQYTTTKVGSGYGYGLTSTGAPVRFYFGMTDQEGAKYIGTQPGQAAGKPGGSGSKKGTGTGFYITRQGHLLTNAHVVDGCSGLTVQQPGSAPVPATAIATDKQNDLALVQTSSAPATTATLRGGRPVRPGDAVVAYGFPLTGRLSSGGALTTGTVSALAGMGDDTRYLQISAPIQPGNSGGPLMDATGAVIGVTTSTYSTNKAAQATGGTTPQNVNFAIKADVMRTFLASSGISAETSTGGRELSPPDIGERARAFTVMIECKG